MRIAIAAEGPDTSAQVSSRGGRAPYYLIAEDGTVVETIKNPFAQGSGGAGFSVAYMMAEKGVDIVIAGKFGDKMAQALDSRGVVYREAGDQTVSEVLASEA